MLHKTYGDLEDKPKEEHECGTKTDRIEEFFLIKT